MPMAAAPMMADAEVSTGSAPPPPPMDVAQADVVMELAATTFSVTTAEDIPSDGTERKVVLTTQALSSELRYVVAPRLDLAAYLVGEVTNTADFALLPGEAGVFLDGDYVGKTWLEAVPTGEDFDLSFGPDDAVTVARSRGETSTGDGGPAGRRQRAQWSWTVDVASSRPTPIAVEVREQVPLSSRDDVTVDWSVDDGAQPEEEDGGVLSFSLSVPARGRAGMTWGYVVTYPGDTTMGWME